MSDRRNIPGEFSIFDAQFRREIAEKIKKQPDRAKRREIHSEAKREELEELELLKTVEFLQEEVLPPMSKEESRGLSLSFPEATKRRPYIVDSSGLRGHSYDFFSPLWHIKSRLVTAKIVEEFKGDDSKKLLSVGAGPAYLEQTLVKLDLKSENITLTDRDDSLLPQGFPKKKFDWSGEWPDFGNQFDLIIFPESTLFNRIVYGLPHEKAVEEQVEIVCRLVRQALENLTPSGEIRMDGVSFKHGAEEIIFERIISEHPDREILWSGGSLVIRKREDT